MVPASQTDLEVQTPAFGVLGNVPSGADTTRVDLRPEDFAAQIELHGKRLAWTRACRCPCLPVNTQTEQPDPNCRLCHGLAWMYFGDHANQGLPDQTLTAAQRHYIMRHDAFLIRGVLMGLGKQDKPWDANTGAWRMGMASVTVRPENRLGFQDRLVNLDDRIVFSEVVQAPSTPTAPLPLRYTVAGGVYLLRTEARVLRAGRDFSVRGGRIVLLLSRALPPETRLAVHYVTFPTFLVQDIPNVSRETSVEDGVAGPKTGIGRSMQLPVRATIRLEFLPDPQGLS